jgi:hypothetical protein
MHTVLIIVTSLQSLIADLVWWRLRKHSKFNSLTGCRSQEKAQKHAQLNLYDKAYANRDKQIREEYLLRRFLDGLNDERIRFHVEYIKEPNNIDQIKNITTDTTRPDNESPSSISQNAQPDPAVHQQNKNSQCEKLVKVIEKVEQRLEQMETFMQKPTWSNRPDFQPMGRSRPNGNRPSSKASAPQAKFYQNYVCFKCNQEGHIARGCPNMPYVTGLMQVAVQHPITMNQPGEPRMNNNTFNTSSTN